MGKRAEKEQAAIELYAGGMEIPQVSAELGVSENSLREWRKRAGEVLRVVHRRLSERRLLVLDPLGHRHPDEVPQRLGQRHLRGEFRLRHVVAVPRPLQRRQRCGLADLHTVDRDTLLL